MSKLQRKSANLLSRVLAPFEKRLLRKHVDGNPEQPPVFILGPPRTGTTLLFQLMTSCFETTYFRNLTNDWFPRLPLLTQKAARLRGGRGGESYRSSYGRTPGHFAQAEATRVLARWFPHQHPSYLDPESIPLATFEEFRDTVAALTNESGRAFVCKNAWNCFRVSWLHALFPSAVFVIVRRNIIASAQSDLEAKLKVKGDPQAWNSASPKEYEAIRAKPYWEQVVDQQFFTWKQLYADRERLGAERFLEVWYEHVCTDPRHELERMAKAVEAQGGTLVPRDCDLAGIKLSDRRKVTEEDYDRISTYAASLGSEWINPPDHD